FERFIDDISIAKESKGFNKHRPHLVGFGVFVWLFFPSERQQFWTKKIADVSVIGFALGLTLFQTIDNFQPAHRVVVPQRGLPKRETVVANQLVEQLQIRGSLNVS